jgi:uroporphyrinogen decarboxylase
MMYARPDLLHQILSINARAVTAYLNAQIEAGAQVVMLFDTWGGSLSGSAYREYSLTYMQQVVSGLLRTRDGERIPSILFTKGGGLWLEEIAATGADAVGIDWSVDIGAARRRIGATAALQGNLDPAVLFGSAETISREIRAVLDGFGQGEGHIFNLGHGISQFTDPERVGLLIDIVHEQSRRYH